MRSPRSGWLARPIPGKSIVRTSIPLSSAAYPTTDCRYSNESRSTTRRGCIDRKYEERIVARRDQAAECRHDDDFDVRSALRPRFIGNAHVHVALEATIRRKQLTGADRSLRALLEDFLPRCFELRSDSAGQGRGDRIDLAGIGRATPCFARTLRDQHDEFRFRHQSRERAFVH